jgi:hypothetical protein
MRSIPRGVPVIRDDEGRLLEQPVYSAFITAPAVNAGVVLQRDPSRRREIRSTMATRIAGVLGIAALKGHDALVLGAWGCGVFRNDPQEIAELFRDALTGPYRSVFSRIVFAIFDRSPDRSPLGGLSARLPGDGYSPGNAWALIVDWSGRAKRRSLVFPRLRRRRVDGTKTDQVVETAPRDRPGSVIAAEGPRRYDELWLRWWPSKRSMASRWHTGGEFSPRTGREIQPDAGEVGVQRVRPFAFVLLLARIRAVRPLPMSPEADDRDVIELRPSGGVVANGCPDRLAGHCGSRERSGQRLP